MRRFLSRTLPRKTNFRGRNILRREEFVATEPNMYMILLTFLLRTYVILLMTLEANENCLMVIFTL